MPGSRALKQVMMPKTADANKGQCVDTNQGKKKASSNGKSSKKQAGKTY